MFLNPHSGYVKIEAYPFPLQVILSHMTCNVIFVLSSPQCSFKRTHSCIISLLKLQPRRATIFLFKSSHNWIGLYILFSIIYINVGENCYIKLIFWKIKGSKEKFSWLWSFTDITNFVLGNQEFLFGIFIYIFYSFIYSFNYFIYLFILFIR